MVVKRYKTDTTFAARFRAYGRREYVTLGRASEGCTRASAELELQNILADVRRGAWQPPQPETTIETPRLEPTFHEFASEWLEGKRQELRERSYEDYRWALTHHLLPFFARHRLSQITKQDVDRYKTAKIREREANEQRREQAKARGENLPVRGLGNNQINKTITRLAQILEAAVDYDYIPANPANGKRRRLKTTRPERTFVEPEQLPILLDVAGGANPLLAGRGRPLLATMAGAGLRVDEALSLERRHISIPKGTLTVEGSKTAAGVRVIDLTPALRDELALWLDRSSSKQPTDLVFPTLKGKKDNRQNVRCRLLHPAIARANVRLTTLGIAPIGNVSPHGLRRTFASLRCAVGDDVAFTSAQLGHEDPAFTLRVYTHAVKRRERLAPNEREQFERAVEWAQWALMGTSSDSAPQPGEIEVVVNG